MHYARITAAMTAIALCLTPVAPAFAAPSSLSVAESPAAEGFDAERLKRLDDYMASVVAEGRVAGMTTLLARHGKIVEF